jgi:hypothetical protein
VKLFHRQRLPSDYHDLIADQTNIYGWYSASLGESVTSELKFEPVFDDQTEAMALVQKILRHLFYPKEVWTAIDVKPIGAYEHQNYVYI